MSSRPPVWYTASPTDPPTDRTSHLNGDGLSPRCTHLGWGGQGAGLGELLPAFDAMRGKHEGMEAAEYNDDGTYKASTIEVRTRLSGVRPALRAAARGCARLAGAGGPYG